MIQSQQFSLEGKIAHHGLSEVLQLLELGNKSGLLSVQNGQPVGVLYFEKGAITFAHTQLAEGFEATLEILSQDSGFFRFYPAKSIAMKNCRLSPTRVLLQWAARVDENRHRLATVS